jgi:hypothetical protein
MEIVAEHQDAPDGELTARDRAPDHRPDKDTSAARKKGTAADRSRFDVPNARRIRKAAGESGEYSYVVDGRNDRFHKLM